MLGKYTKKYADVFYFVFRVIVGILFLMHGLQKLFGLSGGVGGGTVQLVSLFGFAGIIELIGGLLITIGLFARWGALFGIIDMIGAWIVVHIPQGWNPLLNGGELPFLFLASFLVILAYGPGKWSLMKNPK